MIKSATNNWYVASHFHFRVVLSGRRFQLTEILLAKPYLNAVINIKYLEIVQAFFHRCNFVFEVFRHKWWLN